MKRHFTFVLIFISIFFSPLSFTREILFDCINLDESSTVWGLQVMEVTRGRRVTFEIDVQHKVQGEYRIFSRKVNLVENYGGRILTFGTGNTRVKVDRAIPISTGRFKSFVRLPDFEIHSKDWECKGESFRS